MGIFSFFKSKKNQEVRHQYGEAVFYKLNETIKFPDFTLKYEGTRNAPNLADNASRNFTYYDFIVTDKNGSQKISWTDGAGETVAQDFNVNGKQYFLELKFSEKFVRNLGDNELVILTKQQFDESRNKFINR